MNPTDRDDRAGSPPPDGGHVIVCGLGGLGLRIVEQLRIVGEPVLVVDDSPDRRSAETLEAWGLPLVRKDAARAETLHHAGLAGASAVVCVEPEDLRNLHIALLARDLRADVPVVTALSNAAVGRAVDDDEGPGTVLDIAALVTPSLVEACLDSPAHELDVAGHRFLAASATAGSRGTLRTLFGDLAPLAVTAADGRTVICPGRDHPVEPDDQVAVLGTPDELAAAAVHAGTEETGERRVTRRWPGRDPTLIHARSGRGRRALAALAQAARESDRGLRWALAALAGLIGVSTLVIRFGYQRPPGMGWIDSLYFTVESVATVGFGDFSFSDQAVWLRLWAIFLMLAGVATTAIPLAFLTDLLISRRLAATAGRRKAASATGHVVVVGLGAIGVSVVAALRERGRDVVVVERDPQNRFLERARALAVPVVFGDATSTDTLDAARVGRAAAVAVLTSDDMANIETGLAVRDTLGERRDATPVVLRLFDRDLARTVSRRFDFRFVRSTTELAAPWFVGAALGLDVLGTFPVHRRAFLLGRLRVDAGGGLDGLAMQELSARTRVIGLRRAGSGVLEHPPRRDTRFGRGDEAFLVGPYEELLEVLGQRRPVDRLTTSPAPPVPAPQVTPGVY